MTVKAPEDEREPALLATAQLPDATDEETLESLDELRALADTAGARVVDVVVQKRRSLDPATLVGAGKIEELARGVDSSGATLVIFDNELTVSQQDRLAEALGIRVIDRTALILDIFAQHAHTSEGATQVELAQLSYLLPRIRGRGIELSRMGGGIGTRRGPGETQLEVDRRRIRRRMRKLDGDLDRMEGVRRTQRKRREKANVPSVCLIGYTNSGKSSLLNRMTNASVPVEDQLFSTLDSTTRRLELPGGREAVLSDTVGFIRKLPHELVAAFRSTLEVVRDADLLVHVVDCTRQETLPERIRAVEEVLEDLGAREIPTLLALNKIDAAESGTLARLAESYPDANAVSARTGEGIDLLLHEVARALTRDRRLTLRVPAGRGDVISGLHRDGSVHSSEVEDETMVITVSLPPEKLSRYADFL